MGLELCRPVMTPSIGRLQSTRSTVDTPPTCRLVPLLCLDTCFHQITVFEYRDIPTIFQIFIDVTMSREVSLQADVGSLGLQGLGAFTSILATLSADDVVPMALLQMEQLGNNFPVNGKLAEDIKGLLQRCKDVRLDHFAGFIGWRKNDSASLMAESAGGQAIALLSVCLKNLLKYDAIGITLLRLCSKLCPRTTNVSSASQLEDIATLLADKTDALGFGNLLAKEVAKIYDVYHALGRPSAPTGLLEALSVESIVELLEKVSQALRQDNKICRISGYRAMGHIVGLIRALFPYYLVVTIEGVIVQDVEHPKIRCEIIDVGTDGMTKIYLETSLSNSTSIRLPIETLDLISDSIAHETSYSFNSSMWLADQLRLIFLNHGLMCSQSIMQASCDLLVLLPASLCINEMKLVALLGPLPRARMALQCEHILGCTPTEHHMDLETAFVKLKETVTGVSDILLCTCTGDIENRCDWNKGWRDMYQDGEKSRRNCPRSQLWNAIGCALQYGLWWFFIDVGPNVTICPEIDPQFSGDIIGSFKPRAISEFEDAEAFLSRIFRLTKAPTWGLPNIIIASSGSSTLFPTVLKTMKMPSHQLVTFTMVEGRIVHEQRYHQYLQAAETQSRPKADFPLMEPIVPSHIGVHSGNPLLTIREVSRSLELHISIEYARSEVKLNLMQVILGYIGTRWTTVCAHPVIKPMDPSTDALATSVASPAAAARRLGVVMTRWNPMAQFLCCEYGYQAILQKECCLDCAADTLGSTTNGIIIVG